ncbi:MAG: hypothetical protein AAGH99_02765 [Planctomycetota bacterium]
MKSSFLTFCVLIVLGGCAVEGTGITRFGGIEESYHPLGETVTVTPTIENNKKPTKEFAGAAAAVVGFAVDYVEEKLREEAARHTQQYSGTCYAQVASGNYLSSFTVKRMAKIKGKGDPQLASEAVFNLTPVAGRMFRIDLISVQVDWAKAKVVWGEEEIDIDYTLSVEGIWTANGVLQKHNLLTGGSVGVRGYDITQSPLLDDSPKPAGYVFLPEGKDIKDLVLNVTVAVSERDASKAAELYVNGADLLRDNKDDIVGAVVGDSGDADADDADK